MPIRIDASQPRRLAGTWALLFLDAAGCGRGAVVSPPVNAERAREVLRETLDAWKGGKPHDSLIGLSQPIRVADEDWFSGSRLISYEVSTKDQVIGGALRCPVSLALKDGAGKDSKKLVIYNVKTARSPSVIRQD